MVVQKWTASRRLIWLALILLVVSLFTVAPTPALAQGCAMCRTALSVEDPVTQGFNYSILFLMAMPYVAFAGVAGWVWRKHSSQLKATVAE